MFASLFELVLYFVLSFAFDRLRHQLLAGELVEPRLIVLSFNRLIF